MTTFVFSVLLWLVTWWRNVKWYIDDIEVGKIQIRWSYVLKDVAIDVLKVYELAFIF